MDPHIGTGPPGPKARTVLALSMVREYPHVSERAEGTNLRDVDGNRCLHFTAGIDTGLAVLDAVMEGI